jgi:hypothetical protein
MSEARLESLASVVIALQGAKRGLLRWQRLEERPAQAGRGVDSAEPGSLRLPPRAHADKI